MIIILMDLSTYADMNDLDLDEIEREYSKFKSSGIIATNMEKFKKTEDDENEE